jgi:anti-sigma factor RsiW
LDIPAGTLTNRLVRGRIKIAEMTRDPSEQEREMTVPEERLLAYVDGLLSPGEIAEINRQLADDADAREIVE